jgi:hypothetical protein
MVMLVLIPPEDKFPFMEWVSQVFILNKEICSAICGCRPPIYCSFPLSIPAQAPPDFSMRAQPDKRIHAGECAGIHLCFGGNVRRLHCADCWQSLAD